MGISTGRGDGGMTEAAGKALSKADALIEALGTLDELQAFLSRAAHATRLKRSIGLLESTISGLARAMGALGKSRGADIGSDFRHEIDKAISDYEAVVQLDHFVLPGRKKASADLDICRTICRRAERRVVALDDAGHPEILRWLNRLSDWLFLAARAEELPKALRRGIPLD